MKRQERVDLLLYNWTTEQFDLDAVGPAHTQGLTAEVTGEQLGIDRSNASRDLNGLVSQKKAIKIGGKPVLFFSYSGLIERLGEGARGQLAHEYGSWLSFADIVSRMRRAVSRNAGQTLVNRRSAFDSLQGRDGSLKKPIELAKAAILYPPDGLHTLLTGPTGVGKTLFADCMFRFAVETERFPDGAPFIAFNCADYANNPQLLLAQLFGVEKGAYTGADRDRPGLVEKADGGVLFLDEVHRLPPEGQEMLFTLLDRGMFRRLGEADTTRKAKIRLVAATTEDVQSSLLITFIRRIPMWIGIPSLEERTLEERFALIHFLFQEESARVQRPFWIASDVLKALLLFDCPANVGQLKSEIQLICARAFLAQMQEENTNLLKVSLGNTSDHVYRGLLKASERRQDLDRLLQNVPKGLLLHGTEGEGPQPDHDGESVYEMLEQQAVELRRRGLNEDELNRVLSGEIDVYFRRFLQRVSRQFESRRHDLAVMVGEEFLQVVEEMFDLASLHMERVFSSQTVFGAALHLRAAVDRLGAGAPLQSPGLANLHVEAPDEYRAAGEMVDFFAERTGIRLPESEVGFVATLLASAVETPQFARIGVIVVAHGASTASSLLETAQQLLGTGHGVAYNVPLEMPTPEVTESLTQLALQVDEGKGVLLLVDMGDLLGVGDWIQANTDLAVRTVPGVTTRLVMDAVRRAAFAPGTTLESLQNGLVQRALGDVTTREEEHSVRRGVLPVVCVTGQGSAMQLKAILEERLVLPEDYELQIVPISITSLEETPERMRKLVGDGPLLAVAGTLNPNLEGVPFVSAQEILTGVGLRRISHLIGSTLQWRIGEEPQTPVWEALIETLRRTVRRVNPYFLVPEIVKALEELAQIWGREIDVDLQIGVTMHLVMAIEHRMQRGVWPTEERGELPPPIQGGDQILHALQSVTDALGIEVPACELGHLWRLLAQGEVVRG
ncbi:sigma 54-interacting transcriptional regulator [Tumebacillus sp. ITR2]|uniref:Sigma 54-interacting transcriptional regulator n=1 Tax=Tumebacillus amylolyticus TaxID=2801339 RepID=A0ABS1JAN1_9BACL|nr:sigma-54-dependent transcriptional regulator [Tumebacillus amylolyticus]MBL0387340.1 sigma 54-interacting transcriptional regulator [Tumebacillus amylolyticus]